MENPLPTEEASWAKSRVRGMKSLRARRRRSAADDAPTDGPSSWNTVATLGAGAVAAVDGRGAVYPYGRPVSVECWFGVGDRWLRGGSGDGVRQRRVDGLPIIETRQRPGDDDLVLTTWADESGDGRGRVVVELVNETDEAVVVAVVVRPHAIDHRGTIGEIRVAGSLVVVDRVPLVELGREPGDVVTADDPDRAEPAVLTALGLDRSALQRDNAMESPDGTASLAALIPLTPGVDRRIEIFDGAEAASVASAPLENITNGWKAHLGSAAEFELPRWPGHVPAALITGAIAAVAEHGAPPGDDLWREGDDALLATALAGIGVDWGAAEILDRLLDGVVAGRIDREAWVGVACAVAAGAHAETVVRTLEQHGEALAVVSGESLSTIDNASLRERLVVALAAVHGVEAADDAQSIRPKVNADATRVALRHGFGLGAGARSTPAFDDLADQGRAITIAAQMLAAAALGESFEPIVPVRSAAGSTWRWSRGRCGDSPHARAALLIAMRGLCVAESPKVVDVFPGADKTWLGQSAAFSRLPTAHGTLSCALRWHGARAALLWEFDHPVPDDLVITSSILDPTLSGSGASGEVLLAEPTHLVGKTS